MVKEKKQFKKLAEEELKNVTGGTNNNLCQDGSKPTASGNCHVIVR